MVNKKNKDNCFVNKGVEHKDVVDVIRGIGIIMILLVHYGQSFEHPLITRFGQMGCQLFFVMSGYTCSMSFANHGIKKFYIRRLLSIVPEYYTMLIAVVCTNIAFQKMFSVNFVGPGNVDLLSIVCNIFIINGILPFCNNNVFPGGWFIGTLVVMYCLHPLFDHMFLRSKCKELLTVVTSFGMIICGVVLNYIMTGTFVVGNSTFNYYCIFNQLGCYMIGMYMFHAFRNTYYSEKVRGFYNFKISLAVIVLLITITIFYSKLWFRFAIVPFLMGVFTFLVFMAFEEKTITKRLRCILATLGKNSFYIYLTHTFAVWTFVKIVKLLMVNKIGISDRVSFFLLLPPSFVMALILSMLLKKIGEYERMALKKWCQAL